MELGQEREDIEKLKAKIELPEKLKKFGMFQKVVDTFY